LRQLQIQHGGSAKPDNAAQLMATEKLLVTANLTGKAREFLQAPDRILAITA